MTLATESFLLVAKVEKALALVLVHLLPSILAFRRIRPAARRNAGNVFPLHVIKTGRGSVLSYEQEGRGKRQSGRTLSVLSKTRQFNSTRIRVASIELLTIISQPISQRVRLIKITHPEEWAHRTTAGPKRRRP